MFCLVCRSRIYYGGHDQVLGSATKSHAKYRIRFGGPSILRFRHPSPTTTRRGHVCVTIIIEKKSNLSTSIESFGILSQLPFHLLLPICLRYLEATRMHWKTRLFIAICLTSFAAQALAPWVNLRHAVQSWLGQPKLQERPRWRKKPKKPEVIPFVESTQCSTWLRSVGDTIVYNYSPYKPHPTAHALRSCILSDEASEVRTTIKELLIAIPVSGDAELLQEPLLDIVKALPNLERVR